MEEATRALFNSLSEANPPHPGLQAAIAALKLARADATILEYPFCASSSYIYKLAWRAAVSDLFPTTWYLCSLADELAKGGTWETWILAVAERCKLHPHWTHRALAFPWYKANRRMR